MAKRCIKNIGLFLLISTCVLGVFSMFSPLYEFNQWSDMNIYRTIGKAIVYGDKVLYKDIFDQKGLIIFLLYGSLDIFMKPRAIGIFLIEILFNSIFLYYGYKSVRLFSDRINLIEVFIADVIICGSKIFVNGGAVEELILCFIAYALYLFLEYIIVKRPKDENVSLKSLFVLGIMFGLIFWTKFNILFCFAGIVLSWIFDYIFRKQYIEIAKSLAVSFIGFLMVSVPCLFYFFINHAISDMIDSYFIFNIFMYGNPQEKQTIIIKLFAIVFGVPFIFILTLLGMRYIIKMVSNNRVFVIYNVMVFLCIFGYSLMGNIMLYYLLPMCVYIIFAIHFFVEELEKNEKIGKYKKMITIGGSAAVILLSIFSSDSLKYISKNNNNYAPAKFANIIKQTKDHSTLNFFILDSGVHVLLDEVPTQKYYFKINNAPDDLIAEQIDYMKNGEVQFVITNSIGKDYIEKNCKNYKIIESYVNYDNKATPVNYYLFCKDK
ncbi:MAG: glycosyltransferase family 39 protein [Lachnospiraceae bacterium]|nr:glycosyltransferase family 39 protein [Lachnospiraceae bacterium]